MYIISAVTSIQTKQHESANFHQLFLVSFYIPSFIYILFIPFGSKKRTKKKRKKLKIIIFYIKLNFLKETKIGKFIFFISHSHFLLFFFFTYRLERSKVRVSFFQSSKPQQISPPSSENQLHYYGDNFFNNNSLIDSFLNNSSLSETDSSRMTAVIPPDYDRQAR